MNQKPDDKINFKEINQRFIKMNQPNEVIIEDKLPEEDF